MNKHAAEKIASEYYNLGLQLALQNAGLLKTADPLRDRVEKSNTPLLGVDASDQLAMDLIHEAGRGVTSVPYKDSAFGEKEYQSKYKDTNTPPLNFVMHRAKKDPRVAFHDALQRGGDSYKAFKLPTFDRNKIPYKQ